MCRRKKDSPKGRGVGEAEDWSGVLARSAKSMGAKRPALPKKWGPRNTRKDAKGDQRWGREMHFTSRDPTLNAVGTRSCAIRRGMAKKPATAIFDLSLRVGSLRVGPKRGSEVAA
jgi:hypothetical protein